MSALDEPLISALRRATRDLHARAEKEMDVLRADLSEERYSRILWSLHELLTSIELRWEQEGAAFRANFGWEPDFKNKIEFLRRDLGGSQSPVNSDAEFSVPQNGWWGVFYVIEGSSLGARIIHQNFLNDPIKKNFPCHYFSGASVNASARWKAFLAGLPLRHECHVEGAMAAFSFLIHLLRRPELLSKV